MYLKKRKKVVAVMAFSIFAIMLIVVSILFWENKMVEGVVTLLGVLMSLASLFLMVF